MIPIQISSVWSRTFRLFSVVTLVGLIVAAPGCGGGAKPDADPSADVTDSKPADSKPADSKPTDEKTDDAKPDNSSADQGVDDKPTGDDRQVVRSDNDAGSKPDETKGGGDTSAMPDTDAVSGIGGPDRAGDDPKKQERLAQLKKWTAVTKDRDKARSIASAFHNYHETFTSMTPNFKDAPQQFDEKGRLKVSWRVHLLPFLDEPGLYEQFKLDEAWDSPHNKPLADKMPDIYRTDGDKGNKTRFVGFTQSNKAEEQPITTAFPATKALRFRDVTDGISNTILFFRAPKQSAVNWSEPIDFPFDNSKPEDTAKLLAKEELLLVAMTDGRVLLFKSDISAKKLAALVHPRDGEYFDFDELIVRKPNPMEFADPKKGPLHLAYMHESAIGILVFHPQAIFESKLLKEAIKDSNFVDIMMPGAPFDIRKIEEVVFWFTGEQRREFPGYFLMRTTDAETLEAILKDPPRRMVALKHDDRTVVFASENIMSEILDDKHSNQALAELIGDELPKDQVFGAVSFDHPVIKQFTDPAILGNLPLPPQLADERVIAMVSKIKSASLSLNLDQDVMTRLAFSMADKEAADILKTFLTNGLKMAKGQLSEIPQEAPEIALANSLVAGLSLDVKDTTVAVQLKPNDKVKQDLAVALRQAVAGAQNQAQRAGRRNNLKQIGLAFHNYHEVHGRLAPGDNKEWYDKDGKPFLSWRVHLLPFMDEVILYQKFKLNEPWDSDNNKPLLAQMPKLFVTKGAKKGHTSLVAFSGPGTVFTGKVGLKFAEVRDGTSNTILTVEAGPDVAVPWTKPVDLAADLKNPIKSLGKIADVFQVLFMDGSVRSLSKDIDPGILKSLITPAGSEIVDVPF